MCASQLACVLSPFNGIHALIYTLESNSLQSIHTLRILQYQSKQIYIYIYSFIYFYSNQTTCMSLYMWPWHNHHNLFESYVITSNTYELKTIIIQHTHTHTHPHNETNTNVYSKVINSRRQQTDIY